MDGSVATAGFGETGAVQTIDILPQLMAAKKTTKAFLESICDEFKRPRGQKNTMSQKTWKVCNNECLTGVKFVKGSEQAHRAMIGKMCDQERCYLCSSQVPRTGHSLLTVTVVTATSTITSSTSVS